MTSEGRNVESSLESLYLDTSKYRLVYLHASPLIDRMQQELNLLDTHQEIELLRECLRESNRRLHFQVEVATPQNLRTVATKGAVMIHYSGHGTTDILAFENGRTGELHRLEVDALRALFSAGGVQTKVVFVSACHSENAGKKFVEAGVQHVIALNNRVTDHSSRVFARNFYSSLFGGKKTVKESFEIASNMVMVEEGGKPSDEKKFLLLPENSNHDVIIFPKGPQCPVGEYIDETDELAYNGCERSHKSFIGRNREMQQIFSYFVASNNRLVTIRGTRGIGKTCLSSRICEYMNERKLFDAIYFVPLKRLEANTLSDCDELATLFWQCMQEELSNRAHDDSSKEGSKISSSAFPRHEVYTIDDLVRAVKHPFRAHNKSSRSSSGATGSAGTPARILFVIDHCDDFTTHKKSDNDSVLDSTELPSSQQLKASSAQQDQCSDTSVAVSSVGMMGSGTLLPPTTEGRPMGLINLLANLFRKTTNVKCLLTASNKILDSQDAELVKEPEKVIDLDRLNDKQSAELLVKLAPRGLKRSEYKSDNLATALQTLAARPILKDLGGHPRAITMFCSELADHDLDDSEDMRRRAQQALLRAQAWQELSVPSARHIPVAVPIHSIPSSLNCLDQPTRIKRATSDTIVPPVVFSRPILSSSASSSSLLPNQIRNNQIINPKTPSHLPNNSHLLSPPHVPSKSPLSRGESSHERVGPQNININKVDPAVLEEAYKQARELIKNNRPCADVWAKVSALAATPGRGGNGGLSSVVIPTSVRWSSLISALSDSLEAETKVSRCLDENMSEEDYLRVHGVENSTITLSRRLTKEDAKFLFHRMQLDPSAILSSSRGGYADYIVDRTRFMVFCAWWAPLLQSLTILNAEFSSREPILIHGFLNRNKTEEKLLSANRVGVFLLRFSESHAGYLVVSFTDLEGEGSMKVHHCLVNIGVDGVSIFFERGECRYLSLRDLIMSCSNLLILYPDIEKEDAFHSILPFRS